MILRGPARRLAATGCDELLLVPRPRTRPPAADVPAILFVLRAEHLLQYRLLIEHHEKMDLNSDGRDYTNCHRVRTPEHNPQTNPADCESDVHWISHMPVETHDNEALRWGDRDRGSVPGPAEIPYAAERCGETNHGRNYGQPAPPCGTRHLYAETQPSREQLEPLV